MVYASMVVDAINKEWDSLVRLYSCRTPLWLTNNAREIFIKNQIAETLTSEIEDLGLDDEDMRYFAHSDNLIDSIYNRYSKSDVLSEEACKRAIISTLGAM